MAIPSGCKTIDQVIEDLEKEYPGFKAEMEQAKKEMKEDGSWDKLMDPSNWVIEPFIPVAQPCVIERYIKDLDPKYKGAPLYISCTCPRCSPSM